MLNGRRFVAGPEVSVGDARPILDRDPALDPPVDRAAVAPMSQTTGTKIR
jgi:hypothetical protein